MALDGSHRTPLQLHRLLRCPHTSSTLVGEKGVTTHSCPSIKVLARPIARGPLPLHPPPVKPRGVARVPCHTNHPLPWTRHVTVRTSISPDLLSGKRMRYNTSDVCRPASTASQREGEKVPACLIGQLPPHNQCTYSMHETSQNYFTSASTFLASCPSPITSHAIYRYVFDFWHIIYSSNSRVNCHRQPAGHACIYMYLCVLNSTRVRPRRQSKVDRLLLRPGRENSHKLAQGVDYDSLTACPPE